MSSSHNINLFGRTINLAIYDRNTLAAQAAAAAAAASAADALDLLSDTTLAIGGYENTSPTITNGYFDVAGSTASFVSNAAWRSYRLTGLVPGEWYALTMVVNSGIMAAGAFVNGSDTIIGPVFGAGPGSGASYFERLLVKCPAGATGLVGTAPTDATTVGGISRRGGPLVEKVVIDQDRANDVAAILASQPWVAQVWAPAQGYYDSNGAFSNTAGWKQQVFAIEPGQAIRVENGVTNGSVTRAIVWGNGYNSGTKAFANVLAVEAAGFDGISSPLSPSPRIAPPGTTHVAVTTLGDRAVRVFITARSQTKVRGNSATVDALNPLRGKTAVWFGTSIPQGGGVTGTHVTYVAEALGLTITNEAIGGSPARGGVSARKTTGDTYGWTGVSYANLRVCMGKSDAECTDLIDNWVSKWRDRVIGTKPAASALSSEEQAVIRNSSYEVILDRHLGDGNRKDYYIFDHGYNDWAWAFTSESSPGTVSFTYDMETVPGTRFDRSTFIGAMEFYINRIWADNPKARIILIGHFARGSEGNIAAGQSLLATRTDLPFFKLWERTGWSQFQIVGGPADGKAAYEVWLDDGIHPFSDSTGQARDRLAGLLTRWLAENA